MPNSETGDGGTTPGYNQQEVPHPGVYQACFPLRCVPGMLPSQVCNRRVYLPRCVTGGCTSLGVYQAGYPSQVCNRRGIPFRCVTGGYSLSGCVLGGYSLSGCVNLLIMPLRVCKPPYASQGGYKAGIASQGGYKAGITSQSR